MLQGGVLGVDLTGRREGRGGAGKIAAKLPRGRLVAEQADAAGGVLLDVELGLVQRVRVGVLPLLLEQLASAVNRVRAARVELHCAAERLEGLLRLRKRRFRPETAHLLVHSGHFVAQLGLLRHERSERFRAAVEQGDERLGVALLPVQRPEALCGDLLRGVLVDRHHQEARGPVNVVQRRRPNVRGFAEPMARVRRIAGVGAYALKELGVRFGVSFALTMRISQGFFVVRVRHETLDEAVDFGPIHGGRDATRIWRVKQRSEASL
ncbi:MAG: hypothetical protein IPF92_00125 [Myxococcales bacterium]|nr:hypothetical protein [Myxococcales bacterium]